MTESYEKRGTSVRIERSGRATSTIVAHEHGRATRERGRFRAESIGQRPLALAPDVAGAMEIARKLATLERGPVTIERMTVAAGVAEHSVSRGDESLGWNEEVARVHLSLVNRERVLRVAVDLGAPALSSLPLDSAFEVASSLDDTGASSAPFEGLVELAPMAAAQLWRFIADHPALITSARLQIAQTAHPSWPIDGSGTKLEQRLVSDTTAPALFRPSFRVAPVPSWFHVRASLRGVGRPRRRATARIVALLSPFRLTRSSVSAGVLAVTREGSFATTLAIPRERVSEAIVRVARRATWFPFGAGTWGSDTLLDGVTLGSPRD